VWSLKRLTNWMYSKKRSAACRIIAVFVRAKIKKSAQWRILLL